MAEPYATSLTVALPVPDVGVAARWWERVLGRAPDLQPDEDVVEWELAPHGWLQLVAGQPAPAGTGPDASASGTWRRVRASSRRSVELPHRLSASTAFCDVTDPHGNRLSLYQLL